MAKKNYFKPSWHGYRYVMNSHNDVMTACEVKAGAIMARAEGLGGGPYVMDSQIGMNRIHTRVSTDGSTSSWFRERYTRALSIALGASGGSPHSGTYGASKGKRKKFSNTRRAKRRGRY